MTTLPVFILSLALLNPLELNGTFWLMLDQGQKEGVVAGLIISNVYTAAQIIVDHDATRADVLDNVFPTNDVAFVVNALDSFYSDARNAHVLVGEFFFTRLVRKGT